MSQINTHSATWAEVSAWAQQELQRSRDMLESEATNVTDTAPIRARIKLLKRLLELPNRAAPKDEPEVAFGVTPPVS